MYPRTDRPFTSAISKGKRLMQIETESGERREVKFMRLLGAIIKPLQGGGVEVVVRPSLGKETPTRVGRSPGTAGDSEKAAPLNHSHDVIIGKPVPIGEKCEPGDSQGLAAANHQHSHGQIKDPSAHQLASSKGAGFLSKELFSKLSKLPETAQLMFQRLTVGGERVTPSKTLDLSAGRGLNVRGGSLKDSASVVFSLDTFATHSDEELGFAPMDVRGTYKTGLALKSKLQVGTYLVHYGTAFALTSAGGRIAECRLQVGEDRTLNFCRQELGQNPVHVEGMPASGSGFAGDVKDWSGVTHLEVSRAGEYSIDLQYSVVRGLESGKEHRDCLRVRNQSLSLIRIS